MNDKYLKFKCLLEYFVTHLEYIQNNNDVNTRGYDKYLKGLIDQNEFSKQGQGYKGASIQNQIKNGIIMDSINYTSISQTVMDHIQQNNVI